MSKTQLRIADDTKRPITKRFAFTEARIKSATCPSGKPRIFMHDETVRGLALLITASGQKAYYVYAWDSNLAKPIKKRLGDAASLNVDDARTAARAELGNMAKGSDIMAERRKVRTAPTIAELFTQYRDQHLKGRSTPHSIKSDQSRYDLHLSAWAGRKVTGVTPDDCKAFHAELTRTKGGNIADKTLKLLRRMLSWGNIRPNPVSEAGIEFHGDDKRTRFLSVAEMQSFSAALDKCSNKTIADAIRFALLTGARRGNVCGAKWQDIHLDRGLWIIPRAESKNDQQMTIPLVPEALALLKHRKELNDLRAAKRSNRYGTDEQASPYVFPGKNPGQPLKEVKTTFEKVCTAAGILTGKAAKVAGVTGFRFHDLRHTLASWMLANGTPLAVIGKQLGHADINSTARYSHLDLSAVMPATAAATAAMFAKPTPQAKPTKGKAKRKTKAK